MRRASLLLAALGIVFLTSCAGWEYKVTPPGSPVEFILDDRKIGLEIDVELWELFE